ncbi:MAG: hypothetical protein DRJ67_12525 [Thermoprotei archaeon]|nr:MAG: hypothetical protein DRJ67_12525 [Thermoprotei archaeon]
MQLVCPRCGRPCTIKRSRRGGCTYLYAVHRLGSSRYYCYIGPSASTLLARAWGAVRRLIDLAASLPDEDLIEAEEGLRELGRLVEEALRLLREEERFRGLATATPRARNVS